MALTLSDFFSVWKIFSKFVVFFFRYSSTNFLINFFHFYTFFLWFFRQNVYRPRDTTRPPSMRYEAGEETAAQGRSVQSPITAGVHLFFHIFLWFEWCVVQLNVFLVEYLWGPAKLPGSLDEICRSCRPAHSVVNPNNGLFVLLALLIVSN